MIKISSETTKSYATESNLMKALKKNGYDENTKGMLIVKTLEGKFTALFGYHAHGTTPVFNGWFIWDATI